MKKGKMLLGVMVFLCGSIASAISFAEQPAANVYREMFKSGNFYVEYKDEWTTRILAGKDSMRVEHTEYTGAPGWMAVFNPFGALFGDKNKYPTTLYQHGKYYQFTAKNKANMLTWDQLQNKNLDPKQAWNAVQQKLALPDELAVFCWWDPYRKNSLAIGAPQFAESLKKKVEDKEYDCDRYISTVKNAMGNTDVKVVYDMLYENGKLVHASSKVIRNGVENNVNELKIKEIKAEIPENGIKIARNTEVFAAGIGDMNDLIEQPVKVETLNGDENNAQ